VEAVELTTSNPMAGERGGSMSGDGDGPEEPGTTPAPEAGRARGRFEALRQRSSAVQDQVARRRGELERGRHLGLLLVAQRRFKQIEGGDLSVLISLSLFVAMVPLVLLGFSWLTSFSSSANLASLVIRHYGLHEPVAGIVRDTFASASADRSSSSVLGVASWAVAGFPLAVSVQKTFARAWRVPMLGWMASYLRGGLWFLLYVATQFGVEAAKWTLGRNLGLGVLAGLAGVALTLVLWGATPQLLLGKDLGGWPGLVPTAVAGTVVTVGLRLLSLLLLPRWLASWAIPFGAIGTSIALLLVVQLLATGWVVVAAFGAVYWERITDQDTIIRAELDR
jgi:uncharacterized BrkB/YihY/UPF0761 family membrane protein